MPVDPAAAYSQAAVETCSPGQLVVMLYRRAVQSARQAALAIDRKDFDVAHNNLARTQAIVFELQAALDVEAGPLGPSLNELYDYFYRQLIDANLKKDPAVATEVADMLESLLQAWEVAVSNHGRAPILVERVARAR